MNKAIGIVIAVLVVVVSALFFNSYRLSNDIQKAEKALSDEQATNTALGNIIDAYQMNEAANRAATTRQLDNERKLRNESDERLRRFKAAGVGDSCIDSRMPDSNISILRE
ncbi:putative phage antitermination protein Q [Yersinia frederiksenii]|nr:putative phage antitermination protein Q [Yersinia frederiksenii]